LVDLVEDWRFCKRLEARKNSEDARAASRKLEIHAIKVMKASGS
jgi:hypothetical protein